MTTEAQKETVVKLSHPFQHDGTDYTELNLSNRCTAAHCGHISFMGGVAHDAPRIPIAAKMAGVSEEVIREMDPRDFIGIRRMVDDTLAAIEAPDMSGGAVSLPYAYKLKFPFHIGQAPYKEVTFKNTLTLGVVEDIQIMEATWATFCQPIAHMLGITPTEVSQLDPRDYSVCIQIFYPFWQGGL